MSKGVNKRMQAVIAVLCTGSDGSLLHSKRYQPFNMSHGPEAGVYVSCCALACHQRTCLFCLQQLPELCFTDC
jgi:hypothetical protein